MPFRSRRNLKSKLRFKRRAFKRTVRSVRRVRRKLRAPRRRIKGRITRKVRRLSRFKLRTTVTELPFCATFEFKSSTTEPDVKEIVTNLSQWIPTAARQPYFVKEFDSYYYKKVISISDYMTNVNVHRVFKHGNAQGSETIDHLDHVDLMFYKSTVGQTTTIKFPSSSNGRLWNRHRWSHNRPFMHRFSSIRPDVRKLSTLDYKDFEQAYQEVDSSTPFEAGFSAYVNQHEGRGSIPISVPGSLTAPGSEVARSHYMTMVPPICFAALDPSDVYTVTVSGAIKCATKWSFAKRNLENIPAQVTKHMETVWVRPQVNPPYRHVRSAPEDMSEDATDFTINYRFIVDSPDSTINKKRVHLQVDSTAKRMRDDLNI